ncbi:MAG: DNA translocase FtsK [Verrucomicrobia bacterium]|nr:DNA translocase FtsK [Verrucomicrobiota bacterium]
MASRTADNVETRGFSDTAGIVLLALSVLLVVALFSYDRNDLPFNSSAANVPAHNWIGSVGAYTAFGLFFVLGAAAYLLPVLLFGFGLAGFIDLLGYLRDRIVWAVLLIVAGMGLLDIHSAWIVRLFQLTITDDSAILDGWNSVSAGGWIGLVMNDLVFGYFGQIGASIVYGTAYVVSLLYLTNFQLGEWVRELWRRRRDAAVSSDTVKPTERELERRARQLQKEAKKLEEQIQTSGLGVDLQPVPEPTVRDLSVSQPRGKSTSPQRPDDSDTLPELDAEQAVVITANEIEAATTNDVLGIRDSEKKTDGGSVGESVGEASGGNGPVPVDSPALVGKPKLLSRKPKPISVAATPNIGNYQVPSMSLLNHPDHSAKPTESKEELMANARLMQNTLAQFGIEVALGDITKGPTITRYELHPAPGVKLEKISGLTNNIAAALKAERIHILAPVPGKSSVGVEVPNLIKTKVMMRDLLESEEWINTKARVPLALGKDVYGQPIIADLAEMPHLLIAGSTGSGKSVCINSIIASLLYRFSPDQLRFVMIDPKVVELQQYNALPHLVVPVVNDPKKVILALRWVVNEMEKRYQIFAKVGVRNIKSFNDRPKAKPAPRSAQTELPLTAIKEKIEANSDGFAVELDEEIVVPREDDIIIPDKLSYIVVIIDELADLMLVAPADVEMAIARITQMARAAGIHCIVATQRPSVDVITGVIKANIPARIAFQVAARVDSRTILDAMGADKLLGKGDMLYLPPGAAKLTRAQGALITDQEIQDIVDFISKQGKPSYEMEIHKKLSKPVSNFDENGGCDEDEDLIQQCIEIIRSEQKASVSLMQRRLRLGYTRAARIMDELENRGIVGPNKGAEPRDILIDLDGTGADGAGQ